MFDATPILADGEIVIPSPRAILEHEETHHANSITTKILIFSSNLFVAYVNLPQKF